MLVSAVVLVCSLVCLSVGSLFMFVSLLSSYLFESHLLVVDLADQGVGAQGVYQPGNLS